MFVIVYTYVCLECCSGWTTEDETERACAMCGDPGVLRGMHAKAAIR